MSINISTGSLIFISLVKKYVNLIARHIQGKGARSFNLAIYYESGFFFNSLLMVE